VRRLGSDGGHGPGGWRRVAVAGGNQDERRQAGAVSLRWARRVRCGAVRAAWPAHLQLGRPDSSTHKGRGGALRFTCGQQPAAARMRRRRWVWGGGEERRVGGTRERESESERGERDGRNSASSSRQCVVLLVRRAIAWSTAADGAGPGAASAPAPTTTAARHRWPSPRLHAASSTPPRPSQSGQPSADKTSRAATMRDGSTSSAAVTAALTRPPCHACARGCTTPHLQEDAAGP